MAGCHFSKQAPAHCAPGARLVDTAPMSLDEIEHQYVATHADGHDVARLHSGDLSVYSALAEQLRRLERRGIPYTLTGKRMEVPVRRILAGTAPAKAANRDAVANPAALDYFVEYARTQTDYPLADAVGKLA